MPDLALQTIVGLGSALLAIVGFWLVHGRNLVMRDEVSVMIQTEAPYLEDKKFILESIRDSVENKKELTLTIKDISAVLTEIKIELASTRTERQALRIKLDSEYAAEKLKWMAQESKNNTMIDLASRSKNV